MWWPGAVMSNFFPLDPPHDETGGFPTTEQMPWWRPPEDELPVFLAVGERMAVTPRVAVVLTGARVFRNGVEFRLERHFRRGDLTQREWQLEQWGFHGPLGPGDPGRLRYGVALGDGEKVLLDGPGGAFPFDEPPARSLAQSDGSGSGSEDYYRSYDGLWLWPLPPEGPLEVVLEWQEQGIPETRAVLDGGRLRELAAGVTRIWD